MHYKMPGISMDDFSQHTPQLTNPLTAYTMEKQDNYGSNTVERRQLLL